MDQELQAVNLGMNAKAVEALKRRVAQVLAQANPIAQRQAGRDRQATRARAVVRCYKEIWGRGYRLERLESLGSRHLVALVQSWRARGLSRTTAEWQWSVMRSWCVLIGKPGMAPELKVLWPAPEPDEAVASAIGKPEIKASRSSLHEQLEAHVMRGLESGFDKTSYWVYRCTRELELSVEEALLLEPREAVSSDGKKVCVWSARGRGQRVVDICDPERAKLMAQVLEFCGQRGRRQLKWSGISLEKAVRRHTNALTYRTRLARKAVPCGEQVICAQASAVTDPGLSEDICEVGDLA